MPTYLYECDACGASYELRQSFSAKNSHRCEECSKGMARRKLTPPRIIFKGSGFYATDSRGSSSSTTNDTAPPSETKPSKGDTSSTPKKDSSSTSSSADAAAS